MTHIRIALLDMNNNKANQGLRNIKELTENFKLHSEIPVDIAVFDVRYKCQIPQIEDHDIFISSGGPGNPHPDGQAWVQPYANFLDKIYDHNHKSDHKKYLFLICHSFQVACIHWGLGNVCQRKSYSFGVQPIHKTEDGAEEYLFRNLPDPFYAVDSRAYQFIEPNRDRLQEMGIKICAIEKYRPAVNLERAVMAVRFSKEIFGTQFHPEADPAGLLASLQDEDYKNAMIEDYGMEKYLETLAKLEDEDKIVLTQSQILPRFLQFAKTNILKIEPALV